jgi:thiamine-phosphate pyrophosphorylase
MMSRSALPCPQLCLITDPTIPDLLPKVEEALAAGITMLQIRAHQYTASQLYEFTLPLLALCRQYNALCVLNDRLDVGLAVHVDGFQLGALSLPLLLAREVVGESFLLGASVHSPQQAQQAAMQGADFLQVGNIFPSRSHPGEPGSGPSLVRSIKQEHSALPVLAVGGIDVSNAATVLAAGADGIAVISALLRSSQITLVVQQLREILRQLARE